MRAIDELPVPSAVVLMPPAERLCLWAMRAWSAYHTDLTAIWWSLDRAFAQESVHAALAPFHQSMAALFSGLKRWPDIRCVACPRLGRDEARLLGAFAHLQNANEIGARGALQGWVLRCAARVVCRHAVECAQIMSAAGLRFTFVPSPLAIPEASTACADSARFPPERPSPTH